MSAPRPPSFDLVIFDCDGVLIDSELISAQMLVMALANRGVEIDLDYVQTHFLGRSYPTVLSQIKTDFSLDLPEGFEADYRARLLAAFETELKPMPGIEALIRRLALPLCVATSSSRKRVTRSLEITGLTGLLGAHVFTAESVRRGKPAPDLFLHAADRMGADPSRCLVIEDSLSGIRAARAAGMTVCRFTGGSHLSRPRADGSALPAPPADAAPDHTVADFDALAALFPSLWPAAGAGADR